MMPSMPQVARLLVINFQVELATRYATDFPSIGKLARPFGCWEALRHVRATYAPVRYTARSEPLTDRSQSDAPLARSSSR